MQVPIFHVNGDDPEAIVHVVELALQYRQTFERDCVIDVFCYRLLKYIAAYVGAAAAMVAGSLLKPVFKPQGVEA